MNPSISPLAPYPCPLLIVPRHIDIEDPRRFGVWTTLTLAAISAESRVESSKILVKATSQVLGSDWKQVGANVTVMAVLTSNYELNEDLQDKELMKRVTGRLTKGFRSNIGVFPRIVNDFVAAKFAFNVAIVEASNVVSLWGINLPVSASLLSAELSTRYQRRALPG